MKALSIKQPWATLIALQAKRIETRSWSTRYRGRLAIHASASMSKEDIMLCKQSPFREALAAGGYFEGSGPAKNPFGLPLGAIIAYATLVDVVPITLENIPDEPERSFGNYTPGRFAWILQDVYRLPEPIPAKGLLRLWEWLS